LTLIKQKIIMQSYLIMSNIMTKDLFTRRLGAVEVDMTVDLPEHGDQHNQEKIKVYPNVPKFFKEGYPKGYRPWVEAWSVEKDALLETLPDGTFTMTQMDIAVSLDEYVEKVNAGFDPGQELTEEDLKVLQKRAEDLYPMTCGMGCGHCFECSGKIENMLMTTEEVFEMLKEAKELGLKNVKFLGPGELVQNPRLFEILDFLRDNDIKIGIFSKGVVLGDNGLAQRLHGMDAEDLCNKLAGYENVTILLGLTSFDSVSENKRSKDLRYKNYFDIRNRAMENLARAGLNHDVDNQRLAIVAAPVLKDNIDELLEIYQYGLERNIPVIVAPTMLSGNGGLMKEITDPDFKERKLVDLYVDIYSTLINEQLMTLEQIEEEGVSPYAGYACNQFIGGIMVRKDGQIQCCPGNDKGKYLPARDVRKQPLKEIWKNSPNYALREKLFREGKITLTQPCYAKTEELPLADGQVQVKKGCGSISEGFYDKVLEGLRKRFGVGVMEVVEE